MNDNDDWTPVTGIEAAKCWGVLLGVPALVLCIGLVVGLLA